MSGRESRTGSRILTRRRFLWGAGASAMVVGATAYVARNEMQWLETRRVDIPLGERAAGLAGMKIALLTDFHLYPHTQPELVAEAVRAANEFQPDLAILGGDYILRPVEAVFELAPLLERLEARLGVFAILGNHDHWKGLEVVLEGLNRSGAELLRNRTVSLEWEGQPFDLAGLDDGWVGKQDLAGALGDRSGERPTILLMHEPDFADEFARDGRIDLQLSGHSHGGQVRFPFIGSPFLPPYGRRYDQGLYRVGEMALYTSVGIGVTVPIRFNCPPEVSLLTLARA